MRLAHQLVRFMVVQKALMDRIPPQRPVQTIADNAQMAHDRTMMTDFRRTDTVFMLADAVEEIVVVVAAFIEADIVGAPLRPHEFFWLRV